MKVLVSGASGHVGGAIARHLADEGHEVIGLSRSRGPLPDSIAHLPVDLGLPGALDVMRARVPRCDAIIHAAVCLDKDTYNPDISRVNGAGTQAMLRLAHEWNARSFVYISGVAVIGVPRTVPITEDHPCAPTTAYHASKLYGEHLVSITAGMGMRACTLRLTAPIGPGTPQGRLITTLAARALAGEPLILHGKGTRRQNYVDVRDAARAVSACLDRTPTGVYNVGGPETLTNFQLAERVIAALNSRSPIQFSGTPDPEDDFDWSPSLTRARVELAYSPEHDVEASLRVAPHRVSQ